MVEWILDRTEAPVHVGYYWVVGTASTTGLGGILDTGEHEGCGVLGTCTTGEILESTEVPVPWHCETVIGGGELWGTTG